MRDAGPRETDAGCVFPSASPEPYTPDGSEDYVPTPTELANAPPDVALLATWSHVDGTNIVVDMRFGEPPFRTPRDMSISVDWERGNGPEGQECREVDARVDCIQTDATAGVQDLDPGWPPELYFEGPPADGSSVCDHVFVTPTQPFLRMLVPLGLATTDGSSPAPYAIIIGATGTGVLDPTTHEAKLEATWDDPSDYVLSRGSSSPATEAFVSVCDVICPNEQ